MSVSVVITSANEPKTIGKAILSILAQDSSLIKEILVVAPDKKTIEAAKKAAGKNKKVKFIQDPGQGKPTALNLAFKRAGGEILVLTDGDVWVGPNALNYLLDSFGNPKVGGTCGRPISTNSRTNILGFWSHFLTDSAHQIRLKSFKNNQFIELSGYLLAIRKSLVAQIPPAILADDSYLSHLVANSGFKTTYSPEAKVFVKYPTSLADWFAQKRRSTYEYWQKEYSSGQEMRTPIKEFIYFWKFVPLYPKNLKEFFWLILLFWAKTILWGQIFLLKLTKSQKNLWTQIKSTK